jgi:hypothetical protein
MVYNDRKVVPLAKGESVVTNSAYILFYQARSLSGLGYLPQRVQDMAEAELQAEQRKLLGPNGVHALEQVIKVKKQQQQQLQQQQQQQQQQEALLAASPSPSTQFATPESLPMTPTTTAAPLSPLGEHAPAELSPYHPKSHFDPTPEVTPPAPKKPNKACCVLS